MDDGGNGVGSGDSVDVINDDSYVDGDGDGRGDYGDSSGDDGGSCDVGFSGKCGDDERRARTRWALAGSCQKAMWRQMLA